MTEAVSAAIYTPMDWNQAWKAFLVEKEQRSGSRNTVDAYGRTLERFFGELGLTPDQVMPDMVHGFIHSEGLSGRRPARSTSALRLAAISSFYRFLIRMGHVDHNPCERVQRPKMEQPPARGLSVDEVKRLLHACPDTCAGRRDKAIILTLVYTGRRRSEIMGLKVGDLSQNSGIFYYSYRGKGGLRKTRELPEPCFRAIVEGLKSCSDDLALLPQDSPLFNVSAHGFYLNLRRYFQKAGLSHSGVHVLRHTAAKLRRDAGETVEQVSSFLDHSDLAVTSTYLRRLEGEADDGWRNVAALLGSHDVGKDGGGTTAEPPANAIESGSERRSRT